MTSTCPSCGKPIRPGARFCGNCGTTITPGPPVQPQGVIPPTPSPQTPTPVQPPPAASPPPPGVQAPGSSPPSPAPKKPRSILRRYGSLVLILVILGCAAMFAVGYLLGNDGISRFRAHTATPTPTEKSPSRIATLSKTASPPPATPIPTSTVTATPVPPATTIAPATLTPAATNLPRPTKTPRQIPAPTSALPTAPPLPNLTPPVIPMTIVQENFDPPLSALWDRWGPGQVKVVNDLLVLNSPQPGDSGLSWTEPVTLTQGLTIQFTASIDAKDAGKLLF